MKNSFIGKETFEMKESYVEFSDRQIPQTPKCALLIIVLAYYN